MRNLVIMLSLLLILQNELFSINKIQSNNATKLRFKHFSIQESSNDNADRMNQELGQTSYNLSKEVAKKLNFIHHYRNFLKRDEIFVDKNGNEIIEKGKIYIKLVDKIQLNNFDEITNKNYSHTFGIADLDRIFLQNGGKRITELFKLKSINLINNLNSKVQNFRNQLERTYIIEFDESADVLQFCIDLASNPNVEYAEPVPINITNAVPNDTDYSEQFALTLMQCPAAWDIFKGQNSTEEIIVGVCDSGVDWDHPDLVNNLKHNLGEDANNNGYVIYYNGTNWVFDPGDINNIDDDGNGHVDDFIGWNFFTSDGSIANNPMAITPNSHGTHVAGICNARTDNSTGIAGLPWNIKFIGTKHADNSIGNSIYYGYDGIVYLSENGADVINCSWGGGVWSQTEQNSINYSTSLGTIIVSSAGNDNDYLFNYPASYQNVISVASVNSENAKADYSTYHISVDVSAYGGETTSDGGILSTVPNDSYTYMQGTSMASPYVAALAAYYKAFKPSSSNYDIIKAVLGSATEVDDYNPGYERTLGHGIINAYNAITMSNPDISHIPYILFLDLLYYAPSGNGIINNGETIDWEFIIKNYNHLYGTNNFKYSITTSDPDVTILNGTGTATLDADDYLVLDDIQFQISQNCPNKIVTFSIKFDINDGYEYNYLSSILILNSATQTNAYAFIAYDPVNGKLGPVKFNIQDPSNITLIQDQSNLDWVRAGTFYNNNWYAYDNANKLSTVDLTTGNRTLVKQFSNSLSGLSYDFLSRKLYGIEAGVSLYNVDAANGGLIDFYNTSTYYINLASDKSGNLFSIDLGGDYIYKIGRYRENQEFLGYFNYDLNYAQDMELDYNSDILFATLYTIGDGSIFVAIDKENGFVFEIGNIQNGYELTGLAFPHSWDFEGVKLTSPDYNENEIGYDQTFNWENYSNATNYKIEISLYEDMATIKYQNTINTNSIQLPNNILMKGMRYFWRVIAYNGAIEIARSPIWTFEMILPNYCVSYSLECDEYISHFAFSNINNSSDCEGYSNFMNIIGELRRGKTYNVSLYNPVPYDGDAAGIFIDWNQNEQFDSPNEYYQLSTSDYQFFDGDISVPLDATLGLTVLRAKIVYDEVLDPCSISDYGDVEDYSVEILEKLDEQTIILKQGWNFISSYIEPLSTSMVDIWQEIEQSLLIVKNLAGQVYIPSYGINNIGIWNLHHGYLAYLNNSENLIVYGSTCDPSEQSISFNASWNNISYLRNSELDAEVAFSDLVAQGALLIAKNLAGQVYIPSYDINTIGNMKPGQAYKIYCTKSGTFKFPGN